jgi:KDO2-lipid IV(A) lauroyltransferase
MQFIVYILAYPFLWFISILPFRILYWLSDCLYFLIYILLGYRKKVVRNNLALTLPHLSETARLEIEKKSYRHFCDMFLEMTKTMSISSKEINNRFVITNLDLLQEYESKEKSIMLLISHYASWEWLVLLNRKTSFKGVAVYKKVNNRYFDDLVKRIRSKYNTTLVVNNETIPLIANNQRKNILSIYGIPSDQSPTLNRIFHDESFMGIPVPVHTGAETLAKKYNLNVLYAKVSKVKRGHYECTLIPLSDDAKSVPNFEITSRYLREVEKQILEAPEYYFWTHRRWKHRLD